MATHFQLSYAGFFAKSQIMFSLLSSFQFCPPLKNDGRGVLFCHNVLMLNEYIKERIQALKLSPLVGESVNRQVDERGKCEQKRKRVSYRTTLNICLSFLNGRKMRSGISVIKKYGKEWRIQAKVARFKYSDLCTQACPYCPAKLGTSLRMRGKRTTKE